MLSNLAASARTGARKLGDYAGSTMVTTVPVHSRPRPVTFEDVSKASFRIRNGVLKTSVVRSRQLSELTGTDLWLKNDHKQVTGSFKERGARNALALLSPAEKEIGVIAASAGNHALALAHHGREMGVPTTVVMPDIAPLTKVNNCRDTGATVVIAGRHIGESKAHAMSLAKEKGYRYINGYDDPAIIAGAGTMGVEILEQIAGDLDAVVVPVGGAGLIAGLALSLKTLRPEIMLYGVEPAFCPSFSAALKAGKAVEVPVRPTLADGLAVPMVGPTSFETCRDLVDEMVLVSEKHVALAVLRLVEAEKVIVEGGGAAGLAALLPGGPLAGRPELKGKRVCVPLCGGNIDTPVLGRVIDRGLAADGRLVRFDVTVSDRPGGIAALTQLIARHGVSIKDIYHERAWLQTTVSSVLVRCVCETTGSEHVSTLKRALEDAGYVSTWPSWDSSMM